MALPNRSEVDVAGEIYLPGRIRAFKSFQRRASSAVAPPDVDEAHRYLFRDNDFNLIPNFERTIPILLR